MPRDVDALLLQKWARLSALVQTPEAAGLSRATGLTASYGIDTFLPLEVFNQIWREITGAAVELARHGILEWDARQRFDHPAWTVGSNNELYRSAQSSGPPGGPARDPVVDDGSYWTSFGVSVPNSSTTRRGIIRTATTAEGRAGTGTTPAITPAGLAALVARLIGEATPPIGPSDFVYTSSGNNQWPWGTSNGRVVVSSPDRAPARDSARDISLGSGAWMAAVYAAGTLWFGDSAAMRAWNASTRARDSAKDINVGNSSAAVSDGATLWLVDDSADTARAYNASTRARDSAKDIRLGTGNWEGAASDGTTLWFVDNSGGNLPKHARAYNASTRARDAAKDINLGVGTWRGAASDGTTLWFVNDTGNQVNRAVAYNASTRARDGAKDIELGIAVWRGAVSDGTALWFVDDGTDNAIAYTTGGGRSSVSVAGRSYGHGIHALSGITRNAAIAAQIRTPGDFAVVYPRYNN